MYDLELNRTIRENFSEGSNSMFTNRISSHGNSNNNSMVVPRTNSNKLNVQVKNIRKDTK